MLKGFKENVIMGHLIPAGTGLPKYKNSRSRSLRRRAPRRGGESHRGPAKVGRVIPNAPFPLSGRGQESAAFLLRWTATSGRGRAGDRFNPPPGGRRPPSVHEISRENLTLTA